MTDISPLPDLEEEDEEEDEDDALNEYELYVEIATRMIYQVKLFDNFALIRPASPLFFREIRKMSMLDFSKYYEEFYGDHDMVRAFFNGDVDSELEVFE
jgi:hypothetical protein